MKNISFSAVLFILFISNISAQDLIIGTDRDSLNCNIIKDGVDSIQIEFLSDGKNYVGFIHKDKISYLKKNVFNGLDDWTFRPWYRVFEVGVDIGVTHQIGRLQQDKNVEDQGDLMAKTGLYAGVDFTYFVNELCGYGIKYHYIGVQNFNIGYQSIGVLIAFRFFDKDKKNSYVLNFSPGYGNFKHKEAYVFQSNKPLYETVELSSKSVSLDISIAHNFKLYKNLDGRVKLSGTYFTEPDFIKVQDSQKYGETNPINYVDYGMNQSSINLSFGITLGH